MDRKSEARNKQGTDRIEQSDTKMKQIKSVKRVITEEDFDRVSEIIEREGEGQQVNRHKDKEGQEEKRRKIQEKIHVDSPNQEITNIQEDSMIMSDTNGGSNVHNKDDEMEIEQLRQPNENNRRSNMADNILEKYKIVNDKLIREVSTNTDPVLNKSTLRFDDNHKGPWRVRVMLRKDLVLIKRGKNLMRIFGILNKHKISPSHVMLVTHASAEISFDNSLEANSCLDIITSYGEKSGIMARMEAGSNSSRGVITDWPESIQEFWEAVTNREDIIRIERLYTKKWRKEDNSSELVKTDNLIITFKGNDTRGSLSLWNNAVRIKVRPYIVPVKQCYKCFRFGHTKTYCKSEERCIVCGDKFHGRCSLPPNCVNCNGNHLFTWRGCQYFQFNRNIQAVMAYNNVSYARAKLVLEGKENVSTIEYNRYRKPDQWPNLYQRNTESSIEKETRTDNPYNKMTQGRSYSSALMTNKSKDRSEAQENISYVQEKRNAPPVSRIKSTLNRNSEYYKQFNTREEDITRERRGLVLRNKINDPHEYSVLDRSAKDSVMRESGFSAIESFIRDNIIIVMQHLSNILGKDDRTKGEAMEAIISAMSNDIKTYLRSQGMYQ